jgi:uncharacterized protein YnzC (UPF0291/DUF896 family)
MITLTLTDEQEQQIRGNQKIDCTGNIGSKMKPLTKKEKSERAAYIAKAEKRYLKAWKGSTKVELLHLILSALDCPGHFTAPKIKNPPKASFKKMDTYFSYGDHPIVLCSQCVDRMREALCLEKDEPVPSSFQYEGWRAVNEA